MRGPSIELRKYGLSIGVPTGSHNRKATSVAALWQGAAGLRAVGDLAHAQKHLTQELGGLVTAMAGWMAWPHHEPHGGTMVMHGDEKSDRPIVPKKAANKRGVASFRAERLERRGRVKRNPFEGTSFRTQRRVELSPDAERIRQAARRDGRQRFTALWHHVCKLETLRESYDGLKPQVAPGVDGETWQAYGEELEDRLHDLADRLKRGAYRAPPVQRAYIPKPDGRQRPIGIPTLEDKIVQRAVASVLQGLYEADFVGFSYGFRPGRRTHDALDALAMGIGTRKTNWVLDADIRGFFDSISHDWMLAFLEHRVADRRILRQIRKWLKAGVMEEGQVTAGDRGTPQGGSISPLLANIYLHYVFDLWVNQWRCTEAKGEVIVVRYADDFVVGFQHEHDAKRFLATLHDRLRRFDLEPHGDKTRLIAFGRYAAERRARQGLGKPETFAFLGFTHICRTTKRHGHFYVWRRPRKDRMRAKLKWIKEQLKRCRCLPIAIQGRWLRSVVSGWLNYYAVPYSSYDLGRFYRQVCWLWYRWLNRRSQRSRLNWGRMNAYIARWLPRPRIVHPYPWERLRVIT